MAKKRKFDYFDAFERLAQLAVDEADILVKTVSDFEEASALSNTIEAAREVEHMGDNLNHDVFRNIATDFMPPIDREDLIALAQELDNVIDNIEEIVRRFYMYDIRTMPQGAIDFSHIIKKSCKALHKAMGDFRNFKKSKKFNQLIMDVNDCEEEGDQLLMQVMRDLHTIDADRPMHVQVWSQLYERMEKATDSCEHAADTMTTIILKNV